MFTINLPKNNEGEPVCNKYYNTKQARIARKTESPKKRDQTQADQALYTNKLCFYSHIKK